jgi:hypothetical protein
MKTSLLIIIFSLLFAPTYASDEIFIKAHNAFISIGDKKENTIKAIEILSKGLSEDPLEINLLIFRAQLNTSLGEFNKAYQDVKLVTHLRPKASSYKFWECTFVEKFNGTTNATIDCYKKTSELVAAELGDKKDSDFGYIYTLLLAENPQGKVLAENLLKTLTNSTTDKFYRELLENFDRKNSLPKATNESANW